MIVEVLVVSDLCVVFFKELVDLKVVDVIDCIVGCLDDIIEDHHIFVNQKLFPQSLEIGIGGNSHAKPKTSEDSKRVED